MNELIKKLLADNPRLSDFYTVGPVQRASVEDFLQCVIDESIKIVQEQCVWIQEQQSYNVQDEFYNKARITQCGIISNAIKKHFEQ